MKIYIVLSGYKAEDNTEILGCYDNIAAATLKIEELKKRFSGPYIYLCKGNYCDHWYREINDLEYLEIQTHELTISVS